MLMFVVILYLFLSDLFMFIELKKQQKKYSELATYIILNVEYFETLEVEELEKML